MSNAKVVAMQDERTNTTHYTDPYDTHMDQKVDATVSSLNEWTFYKTG